MQVLIINLSSQDRCARMQISLIFCTPTGNLIPQNALRVIAHPIMRLNHRCMAVSQNQNSPQDRKEFQVYLHVSKKKLKRRVTRNKKILFLSQRRKARKYRRNNKLSKKKRKAIQIMHLNKHKNKMNNPNRRNEKHIHAITKALNMNVTFVLHQTFAKIIPRRENRHVLNVEDPQSAITKG